MAGKGKPGPAKGDPRCKEYGRKGGQTVKEEWGTEFFKAIGRKGGMVHRKQLGVEGLRELGSRGGKATRKKAERDGRP